jgi:hypothetical protein
MDIMTDRESKVKKIYTLVALEKKFNVKFDAACLGDPLVCAFSQS